MNTKILNRETVKYLAVIAMTFNHAAHALMESGSALFEVFEDIGYFTALTMCYLLVEGYHHTRSRKRYALRLLVFALIAQIPYVRALGFPQLNMLFTLLLCFGILWVMEQDWKPRWRRLSVAGLILLSLLCDWAGVIAVATVLLERARGDRKRQIRAFALIIGLFGVINYLGYTLLYPAGAAAFHSFCAVIGLIASGIILLNFYNGQQARRFPVFHKWFFYVYYPAHLAVLWAVKTLGTS